jgi:hypothetical protein
MEETDQRVASLFTKKSYHGNISVMYIVQNLFHRGKHHRTISLNAHYMSSSKTRETYRRSWHWRIKCIPKGRNTFWKPTLQPLLNPRLFSDRYETRHRHPATEEQYLSRWGTESVRRYLVIYPSLSKINSVLREMRKQYLGLSTLEKARQRVFVNTLSPKPIAVSSTVCVSVPITI